MPKPCETAARKLPKRRVWNLLKTKKKSRLKQGKPLRNVRLGSLQATRPNSRKRCLGRACEKAEPQQVLCPSHCETVAGKMPKRRCWNPLKRERNRAQTTARKLPKRCFWTLLKTKKKPASHQAKLKKKVFGTRMRKGRTPAGFVPKPLRNRSRKNAETSLSEPIRKKGIYAQTMRNRSQKTAETLLLEPTKNAEKRKMPKRCFWNLLNNKKKGCLKQGKPLRNVRLGSLQATRAQVMRNSKIRARVALVKSPTVRPQSSATTS